MKVAHVSVPVRRKRMDDRIAAGRGKVAAVVRVMAVVTVACKKAGKGGRW